MGLGTGFKLADYRQIIWARPADCRSPAGLSTLWDGPNGGFPGKMGARAPTC